MQYIKTSISEEEAHEFYSLLMVSDPYPSENPGSQAIMNGLANAIATEFGFCDWIEHLHYFNNGNSTNSINPPN